MTELEAIKWFEDLIVQTDDVFPECSEALQAELIEQRKVAEVAIEAIRAQRDQKNGGWISVKDRLPFEHDSMFFKKFAGTSKWNPAMFKKSSDEVNVCGVYPDGKTFVTHSRTHDGKWDISSIFQMKITHWQPLPEPPKEDAE